MKEISITKYGSDKEPILTFCPYEIYQYSNSMLKRLPKGALKKLEKALLYNKQALYFNQTTIDRRIHDRSGFTTTGLNATEIATAKKK